MIYMDNSATSFPKPERVKRAVSGVFESYFANPGRSSYRAALDTAFKLYEARERAARFVNTDPQNIVFTYNATHSLNLAIFGGVKSGDVVATSVFEHNSVLRPLYRKETENKVKIRFLKASACDTSVMACDFENMLKSSDKPSVLVLTHTSNVTGQKMPVAELGELCRKNGVLFILDASQGLGTSLVDMERDGVDILCTSGHKGLFGITGSGFMALSRGVKRKLSPLMTGGTGIFTHEREMPEAPPERFEAGTPGVVGAVSIGEGIEYINEVGAEELREASRKNRIRLSEGLSVIKSVELLSPFADSDSIVLFNVKGISSEKTASLLDSYTVACRGGYHCSPLAHKYLGTDGAVRLSVSAFNTFDECDRVLLAVKEISENL